ncbi:hypothetical protein ULF88_11240 [Halopseudomonas pachastrellae]|nr:hypothetical protein [Halopseudomonas pachastrellae]
MGLRDIGRQINRLTAARTQRRIVLHALRSKSNTLALLIEDEADRGIERLDLRIERLSKAALDLINQQPHIKQQLANITCAKGIGQTSAIAMLAELCVLAPRAEVSPSEPLRWPGRTSLPVGQQCEQAGTAE